MDRMRKVRTMLPMTVRCDTCSAFLYAKTKFNAGKEELVGEMYLGIQIYKFYFKCSQCRATIIIKTDPQNRDYIVESGASRNFTEEEVEIEEERKEKRKAQVMRDALETRALETKGGIDIIAAPLP